MSLSDAHHVAVPIKQGILTVTSTATVPNGKDFTHSTDLNSVTNTVNKTIIRVKLISNSTNDKLKPAMAIEK
jgi:hypothetical protein